MNTSYQVSLASQVAYPSSSQGIFQKISKATALFIKTFYTYEDPEAPGQEISMITEVFENVRQLSQDGTLGIMRRVGKALRHHPVEAFSLAGSLALGMTNIGESLPLIPVVLATAGAVRNSKALTQLAKTFESPSFIDKSIKFALWGLAGYTITYAFSFPAAAALEWNSAADARDHYSGRGPCLNQFAQAMSDTHNCLKEGKAFGDCAKLVRGAFEKDLYVFTHHPTDTVSIVQLGENQKVCFLTALSQDSEVTKTCFTDIHLPETRTTELLAGMKLSRAHEGLSKGHSVRHVGLHSHSRGCGSFDEKLAEMNLGDKPSCLLTAFKPDGPVTQTCYNPENPSVVTVKEINGLSLSFTSNGEPVSIVVNDPKLLGLDPSGEVGSKPDCVCEK